MTTSHQSRILVAFALLVHAAALLALPSLQTGGGLQRRFLPEDPATVALLEEARVFGGAEPLALLIDDVAPSLELVATARTWRAELERIPGIAAAISPGDLPIVVWESADRWRLSTTAAAPQPLTAIGRHPLARTGFIRRDGRGAAILLELAPEVSEEFAARARTFAALQAWKAEHEAPGNGNGNGLGKPDKAGSLRWIGGLALERRTAELAQRDVARLTIPLAAIILLVLTYGLGSLVSAALCLVTAALNIATVFGLAAIFGVAVNPLSFAVVPVILSIAVLDNVHLAHAYSLEAPGEQAAASARRRVFVPCLWTTITTCAAMAVLARSPVPQVAQFAQLAMAGTAIALLTSMTLLPAALSFVVRRPQHHPPQHLPSKASTIWTRVYASKIPLVLAFVATVAAAPGLSKLSIVAEYPRIFGDTHPLTTQLESVERDWGGIASVTFLVSPKPGIDPFDSEARDRLRDFHDLLTRRRLVTGVVSPFVLQAMAYREHRVRFGRTQESETMWRALGHSLVTDTPQSGRWYDADTDTYRIVARVRMMHPEQFATLEADLRGLASGLGEYFDVRLSGWPLAYKHLEARLLDELVASIGSVALVLAILLLIAIRDLRLWLAALVVNTVPAVIVFGALGWSGIGFGTALLLTPGIALGLIVDDTIHTGLSLRSARGYGAETLAGTLEEIRRPLTITSTVLVVLAFSLLASDIAMNRSMGIVLGPIVALAWLADVVLLPTLLTALRPRQ